MVSVKTIMERLEEPLRKQDIVPKVAAGVIRNLMMGANTHSRIDEALDAINKTLGGYGVEAIVDNGWDRYYQDLGVLYVNMGDTYCQTVCYDTRKEKWMVCSWGDIVDGNQKRFGGR